MKTFRNLLCCVAVVAMVTALLPQQALADCRLSKKEKIAMISWFVPPAGAIITGMACRRELFDGGAKHTHGAASEAVPLRSFRFAEVKKKQLH